MGKLVIAVLLMSLLPETSLKEFSLARFSDTLVYANNSVIDGRLIGEGFKGDQITDGGALECHTDDTNCCRSTDGMAGGEWYGPDGNVIIAANQIGSANGLYRTRDHIVIRLNRRGFIPITGLYRCEIPSPGDITITRYITLTFNESLCADLPSLTNGDVTYTPPRVLSADLPADQRYQGTIATYSCSSRYQLVGGSTQRVCVGGTWNGTQPSACAIPCDVSQLTNPANGQVSIEGITAIYTCDTGYTLEGSVIRTCQDNGIWSSLAPLCQFIDCGPLTAPANGQVGTSSGTTFGSTATYTCDANYSLSGSASRTCEANEMWSPAAPTCKIIDCGPLTAPANGQVDTSPGTTISSTATYTCDTGYTLVGSPSRTCGADGDWTSMEPACQIIDCGPLTGPANGQVDTSSGTTFGNTATYACDTGYTVVGSSMRCCQANGIWSSMATTCQNELEYCSILVITSTPPTATTTEAPTTLLTDPPTQDKDTHVNTQSTTQQDLTTQRSDANVISGPCEVSGIVGGVIAVVWFLISILIIALQAVYNLHLKRQLKGQDKGQQRSATQYETVDGGSAPEYEVMEGGGAEYEEIDKVKEKRGQPHPPKGDYELTQCTAYGPVNTDM